jgi:uncharacterized protein involved in outer membrane biogenesis
VVRKVLIGLVALVLLIGAGVAVWARSVLGRDAVRAELAAQISRAIGQPVTIGSVSASVYPRVTVTLGDVRIGDPVKIRARTLDIGADFRALLSRRIEQARMRLDGARIDLPLPPFSFTNTSDAEPGDSGRPAVEIVSIDEIVFSDLEVVSGGRTLGGDIEVVPERGGITIRRMTLSADGAAVDVSGRIADVAGPAGELQIAAERLNFDQLLAFFQEFSSGAGVAPSGSQPTGGAAAPTPETSGLNLQIGLQADEAAMGAVRVSALGAKLQLRPQHVGLEPLAFGIFGGRYEGALDVDPAGAAPAFRWQAALSGIDVGAVTRFAGQPDTITGTLAARLDLTGQGADATAATRTARGTARVEIANGIVKNLGLVRTIIVATSMRADAAPGGGSRDEPFRRLSGTLAIVGMAARSNDLLFESDNLRLTAAGLVRLDGSAVDLKGRVQLSEALTAKAGRDLVRYTRQDGRVTLPVTITGPADRLSVRVEVGDLMQRAIRNRATEEVDKAIKKGLGDLLKRR